MSRFKTLVFACWSLASLVILVPAGPAQAREASRWTLQEWLAQRDRNRLMDLWLSMNSPSPFEFMLGISHLSTRYGTVPATTEVSNTSLAGELHAYAQFVGLTVEHENNAKAGVSDLAGMLNIRLLGNSLQNSSLTLHGGQLIRKTGAEELRPLFAQASLQMYLTRYFGIDASYRSVQSARSDVQNADVSGALTKAGLFVDFKSVRVFGSWYQDISTGKDLVTGDRTKSRRIGIQSGLKIYY